MKKLCIALIFLTNLIFLNAEKAIHFTLMPYTSFMQGYLGEHLFSSDDTFQVSYLHWEFSPLLKQGLLGDIRFSKFSLAFSAGFLVPARTGTMIDSDYTKEFEKNRAFFDNYTNPGFDAEFVLAYTIPTNTNFSLAPLVIGHFSYFDFSSAQEGIAFFGDAKWSKTGETVPWDDENAQKYAVSGIDYQRQNLATFIGFDLLWTKKRVSFSWRYAISPYTYIRAHDYHRDETKNGNDYNMYYVQHAVFKNFKTELSFSYKLSSFVSLFAQAKYSETLLSKGLMIHDKYKGQSFGFMGGSDYTLSQQKSGSTMKLFETIVGIKFSW